MTDIHLTLNNFNDFEQILSIFPKSNKYEFTTKKVFRLKRRLICAHGNLMLHMVMITLEKGDLVR